jgi:hypothetical protein
VERDSETDPVVDMTAPGSDTDQADGSASQIPYADLLEPHLTDDVLDEGYSPPDYPPGVQVPTVWEERQGESLDRRLAEEEPDLDSDPGQATRDEDETDRSPFGDGAGRDSGGDGAVGRARSGRLVSLDEAGRLDDMIGGDAGIAGGAASAEEAAVHLVPDEFQ